MSNGKSEYVSTNMYWGGGAKTVNQMSIYQMTAQFPQIDKNVKGRGQT